VRRENKDIRYGGRDHCRCLPDFGGCGRRYWRISTPAAPGLDPEMREAVATLQSAEMRPWRDPVNSGEPSA